MSMSTTSFSRNSLEIYEKGEKYIIHLNKYDAFRNYNGLITFFILHAL